ncbi:hypothetical protein [Rhizobium mayense]|uniref:RNA polymerase sigma factor 70 region 4 type 2 domain-containing protein n=1 Tax=Rhizobium mayense TaxID=1312184 RepID=A0ABT7K5M5_9HYPH|nr:hypothetical protein [Rhizobium mayense]MDL2403918.1 hypothetical protein [Rhizobium mayense]
MADDVIRDVPKRSIGYLPDELRIVFVACVVDGMTPGQFAEVSALTPETVEARPGDCQSALG